MKRGHPVARLVAVSDPQEKDAAILARLRARPRAALGREEDLLAPSSELTRWKLLPGRGTVKGWR
jgi:antitoxin (DNA-binding transcriptional repressor) of toxin-antitoxin stability system